MSKEEYLKNLKKMISILNDDEEQKEIDKIEKKLNEQQDVNEWIKNEPVEKVAGSILINHGIDPKKFVKKTNFIKKRIDDFLGSLKKLNNIMENNNLKSNLKLIGDILILIIFIILIKIPFVLVDDLGESLLGNLDIPFLINLWSFIVDLIYIIIGILIFFRIFTKWVNGLKEVPKKEVSTFKANDTQKLGEDLSSISLNDEDKKDAVK